MEVRANDLREGLWERPDNGQQNWNLQETLSESTSLKLPRVPKVPSTQLLAVFYF